MNDVRATGEDLVNVLLAQPEVNGMDVLHPTKVHCRVPVRVVTGGGGATEGADTANNILHARGTTSVDSFCECNGIVHDLQAVGRAAHEIIR